MLIEFRVKNFLSIKDELIFSALAASLKEHQNNITEKNGKKILNSSVFYGANASGKTNVIRGLEFMKQYVYNSNNLQLNQPIPLRVFEFDLNTKEKPAKFDIILMIDDIKYKYGFSATSKSVHDEYLYYYPNNRETLIFERTFDNYNFRVKDEKMLKDIATKNLSNKLFLTTATNWNYALTRDVYEWFVNDMRVLYNAADYEDYTIEQFEKNDKNFTDFTIDLLNAADINIEDIEVSVKSISYDDFMNNPLYDKFKQQFNNVEKDSFKAKEASVFAIHKVGEEKYKLNFTEESLGTKNLFGFSALLYDVLSTGKCLLIDEIDKSMHPILVKYIVNLFHNKKINSKGAQLFFNTHDTNLLDLDIFRRDQIWFVEKNYDCNDTHIYPLSDFPVRKKDNVEKGYLLGRYGAIPFIESDKNIWQKE